MFLQASVILLTGGCVPQCMLGCHPPEQTPPGSRHPWSRHPLPPGADTPLEADTCLPLPRAETPWEQTPPRADPPGADTSPWEQTPPRADTPSGADTPQSRSPQEQTPHGADTPPPPRSRHPPAQSMLGDNGQHADGTHPTGMHSCMI